MQGEQKVEATFITVTRLTAWLCSTCHRLDQSLYLPAAPVTGLRRMRARIAALLARSANPDECLGKGNQSLHKIPNEHTSMHCLHTHSEPFRPASHVHNQAQSRAQKAHGRSGMSAWTQWESQQWPATRSSSDWIQPPTSGSAQKRPAKTKGSQGKVWLQGKGSEIQSLLGYVS